jgi:WD40 repeat protein
MQLLQPPARAVQGCPHSCPQLVCTLEGHAEAVIALAVSQDGRFVFSGSRDKTARQWEVSGGEVRNTQQIAPVRPHAWPRAARADV